MKRILSITCILFIVLVVVQCVSAPEPAQIDQPKSAATFTIENYSDRDLNVSLYNVENNGTYNFANETIGATPAYIQAFKESQITAWITESEGTNTTCLVFFHSGDGTFRRAAQFPADFSIGYVEFFSRWGGTTGIQ